MKLFKKKKDDGKSDEPKQLPPEKSRLSRSSTSLFVEPMPEPEELNLRFRKVLEELSVPINERDLMMQMPPERKWRFVLTQSAKVAEEKSGSSQGV